MAKRGRKPKERKGYFYETEEQAVIDYNNEKDEIKKNKIFNTILYPALTKMIESLIRRYKLFVPDEDFDENFHDTMSYLITKIEHFKPIIFNYEEIKEHENVPEEYFVEFDRDLLNEHKWEASASDPSYIKVDMSDEDEETFYAYFHKVEHKYKAYSYCGTVCKNYLTYKSTQYAKKRQKNLQYEDVFDDISNNSRYSTDDNNYADMAEYLVTEIANEIENMVENPEENELTDAEITVGKALITLLRNWDEVIGDNDSNKLQKSSVLYFLREETMMTTKEVRDNMKKYKNIYKILKKAMSE